MSLHKLAGISPSHPGSLSCLLYFLCMLAIPIFPLFKFEEFLIYLYTKYHRLTHAPADKPGGQQKDNTHTKYINMLSKITGM